MTEPATSDRGRVYSQFVQDELGREYERRASTQSRASTISGFGTGAVGLAGAGLAIAFGQGHPLKTAATWLLLATLVAFIASTALAVRVFAIGHRYRVSNPDGYYHVLGARWNDSEEAARRATATFAAHTLTSLRSGNNNSATLLQVAGYLQVGGLGLLVLALIIEFA